MSKVLVVANRTVGGRKLLEAVRARHSAGDAEFHLVVPLEKPRHGHVIYDAAEADAAQVRINLAVAYLRRMGIEITASVGDEDPYTATLDAVMDHRPDEVIVSTLPEARSGWLRRDLVERIAGEVDVPVKHVVTDLAEERLAVHVTLVLANRTAVSDDLLSVLREQARLDEDRVFICVVPLEADASGTAGARDRLRTLVAHCQEAGLIASGMLGDPDPFLAAINALDMFTVDKVVISTLPGERSRWVRTDLVERVTKATRADVEHIEADVPETASV
jgi:hypothetical protein